jgi:hypothetical protein
MRRYLLLAAVPVVMMSAGSVFTACSGGGDQGDAGDAGGDVKVPKEAQSDVANDTGVEAGVTPNGTPLAGGDSIRIWGVTSDGIVVFNDTATGGQYADGIYTVPVAGGTPTKIGTPSGSYFAATAGKVVVVWDGLSTNGVGKIHTWTQGGTYASLTAINIAANGAAASPDGQYIIFEANSNTAATVADIVGAKVDGSGQTLLASQVDVGPGNFTAFVNGCVPNFGFPTSSTALVTSCATNPGDAGAPNATVNSYAVASDGGAWGSTSIVAANGLPTFSWDGDGGNGTTVFTATTAPDESLTPVTGGSATPVDTKDVNQGDWTFIYVNRAGTSVLYNSGGALYTSPTTSPTPATVQGTGVNYVRAISSDENWLIYTTTWDKGAPPPASFGSDLFVTKTTAGFTPIQLGTGTTNSLFGLSGPDQFTTDSSHVLWIENLDTSTGTGDFYAMSLPSGTPAKITTGQWQNWSATGAKVVYEDNCALCSATAGKGLAYADIKSIDLSQANPSPTLVQAGADVPLTSGLYGLYMSPTKDRIIYTYSQNNPSGTGDGNGLYSIAVP